MTKLLLLAEFYLNTLANIQIKQFYTRQVVIISSLMTLVTLTQLFPVILLHIDNVYISIKVQE